MDGAGLEPPPVTRGPRRRFRAIGTFFGWIALCVAAYWLAMTVDLFTRSLHVMGLAEKVARWLGPVLPRSLDAASLNKGGPSVFRSGVEPTLGGFATDIGAAALGRPALDPLVANGAQPSATVFALLCAVAHVAFAVVLALRVRAMAGARAGENAAVRPARLGLLFALYALPGLALGALVMRPIAMFWQAVWLQSGNIAWVHMSPISVAGMVSGVVVWSAFTAWTARRRLRALSASAGPGRCGRCGYLTGSLTPCSECGDPSPHVMRRSHITPVGRWLEERGLPLTTAWIAGVLLVGAATIPLWSAAVQILVARIV